MQRSTLLAFVRQIERNALLQGLLEERWNFLSSTTD
jgi:hypothetical protein